LPNHGPWSREFLIPCQCDITPQPREELVGGTHPFIFLLVACGLWAFLLVACGLVASSACGLWACGFVRLWLRPLVGCPFDFNFWGQTPPDGGLAGVGVCISSSV